MYASFTYADVLYHLDLGTGTLIAWCGGRPLRLDQKSEKAARLALALRATANGYACGTQDASSGQRDGRAAARFADAYAQHVYRFHRSDSGTPSLLKVAAAYTAWCANGRRDHIPSPTPS